LERDWIGSIEKGGDVNFFDIRFNPHAHGTHTECLGHVTKERHSVNQALEGSWFVAELITVETSDIKGDKIITATEIDKELKHLGVEAVIIRTRPNDPEKATANLSNSNWPYMDEEAARFLCRHNIQHLLIDQPSVDKEEDGGRLAAHKAFWMCMVNRVRRPQLPSSSLFPMRFPMVCTCSTYRWHPWKTMPLPAVLCFFI
jgi:arylformamidase